MRAGLHGLVTGTVSVSPETGNTFGLEFLEAFLYGGEALGKALQKARRAAGTAGLAYVAFCPPNVPDNPRRLSNARA